MKRKKILYLISIDWFSIKQRPQFLAEELSAYYDVDIIVRTSFCNFIKKRNKEIKPNLSLRYIYSPTMMKLKYLDKFDVLDLIKSILFYLQVSIRKYDIIYVGNIQLYKSLKYLLRRETILIYDCMDDEKEFPGVKSSIQYNLTNEKELMLRSNYIFCTSEYLSNKVLSRTNCNKKIYLIPNGIGLPTTDYNSDLPDYLAKIYSLNNVLLYIGAIAPWFDFDSILYCLNNDSSLNLVLVGPIHDIVIPNHPQIHYLGVAEHRYIYKLMDASCILIMPFIVNELIRSVNPVKLYEYIYSGKNIIASRYGESIKFSQYVNLYSSKQELLSILKELKESSFYNPISKSSMVSFSKNNTWESRAYSIHNILSDCEIE